MKAIALQTKLILYSLDQTPWLLLFYLLTQFDAVSIREWLLFESSIYSTQRHVRALRKASFIRYTALVLKLYFQFLDQLLLSAKWYLHGTSNPFLLPMTSHIDHPPYQMPNIAGQLSRNVTYNLISFLNTHTTKRSLLLPSSSARQYTSPKTGFHTAL